MKARLLRLHSGCVPHSMLPESMPRSDACQRISKSIFFILGMRMSLLKAAFSILFARARHAQALFATLRRQPRNHLPRFEIEARGRLPRNVADPAFAPLAARRRARSPGAQGLRLRVTRIRRAVCA